MNEPPRPDSARPWAVVLAAGESRRFGGGKLTALLAGRPLILWPLSALGEASAAGYLAGLTVVLREGDTELQALLNGTATTVMLVPSADAALSRSLQAGLAALEALPGPPVTAALVCLADQPGLTLETIAALVRAWRSGAGPIIRPRYAERPDEPGHPLLLTRSAWPLAASATGDSGLGPALRERPELVQFVELPGDNPDIDRPEQLAEFGRRLR